MRSFQLDFFFATCIGVLLCYLYFSKRRSTPPLPPGPKPLPIIGNLLDLPKVRPWETFGRWAKEYGDTIHFLSLGRSTIVVNTFKAASDLFEKRSSIYSNRPRSAMFHLMGFGTTTAFHPYGRTWRKHRKLYQQRFNQKAIQEYHPRQTAAAEGLLRLVLESPRDFRQHIRHMAARVVISLAYGHEIALENDPLVALVESNARAFSEGIRPGAYLVDFFPLLKYVPEWVPGAGFQKLARETRENLKHTRNVPFEEVQRRMVAGTARPSFVANSLTELGAAADSNDMDLIKIIAGGIFGAGSDTTTSAANWFVLAMVLYPDVQKKAQAELDDVIGQNRLPQFSDRAHLPYLAAVVKEVFRWRPVAPLAIPHATTEDDIYNGYYIPKGAVVIGNSWAILHDPELYVDPMAFCPERFLPDKDGKVERDPATTGAFGFGRRICPGRYLADAAVWIAVASLLSVFDMNKALDEQGRPVDINFALESPPGLFLHAQPFPCSIKPRSKEAEALIRRTEEFQ